MCGRSLCDYCGKSEWKYCLISELFVSGLTVFIPHVIYGEESFVSV